MAPPVIPAKAQGCPGKSSIGETELILDVGMGRGGIWGLVNGGHRSSPCRIACSDHEEAPCNAAVEPATFFAMVSLINMLHPSVRIGERRQDIDKAAPAFSHAGIVLRIVPLELDLGDIRQ